MYSYNAQTFKGIDGKFYLIGVEKLDYPIGHNNANYETRYIEYKEKYKKTSQKLPSWFDEDWIVVGRYKSTNSTDALSQGIEELRKKDIYPSM